MVFYWLYLLQSLKDRELSESSRFLLLDGVRENIGAGCGYSDSF
jgi:hypothetical protein